MIKPFFQCHKDMLMLLSPKIVPANSNDLFLVCCWLESCVCGNQGPILGLGIFCCSCLD